MAWVLHRQACRDSQGNYIADPLGDRIERFYKDIKEICSKYFIYIYIYIYSLPWAGSAAWANLINTVEGETYKIQQHAHYMIVSEVRE